MYISLIIHCDVSIATYIYLILQTACNKKVYLYNSSRNQNVFVFSNAPKGYRSLYCCQIQNTDILIASDVNLLWFVAVILHNIDQYNVTGM